MTWRAGPSDILTIAIAGALGGGLDAAACLLGWPVPVKEPAAAFRAHVVPAGALHGAVLALVPVLGVRATLGARSLLRWSAMVAVGWIGGYLTWIPLDMSVLGRSLPQAIAWPGLARPSLVDLAWMPFLFFGGVSGLLYGSLLLGTAETSRRRRMATAAAAGVLGSLWWWVEWRPWYFALLHGAVWGGLVGAVLPTSPPGFERRGRGG